MKKFNSYEDLLEEIGFDLPSDIEYANIFLKEFLQNEGSASSEEEIITFEISKDDFAYQIGVVHEEIEEDTYDYKYYLVEKYSIKC